MLRTAFGPKQPKLADKLIFTDISIISDIAGDLLSRRMKKVMRVFTYKYLSNCWNLKNQKNPQHHKRVYIGWAFTQYRWLSSQAFRDTGHNSPAEVKSD